MPKITGSKLLKPCPFCGEPVVFREHPEVPNTSSPAISIRCCFVHTDVVRWGNGYLSRPKAEKQLATLWNMRF